MMQREKVLATVVGVGMGIGIIYMGVNRFVVGPYQKAQKDIANAQVEAAKYNKLIRDADKIKHQWEDIAAHTFSYDVGEMRNRFEQELKRLAMKFHFARGTFSPRGQTKISSTADISAESYVLTGEGDYNELIGFMRDLYRSPFLTQITTISLAPMDPKQGRNRVKLDQLVFETPRLPRMGTMPKKQVEQLEKLGIKGDPKTMTELENPPTNAVRKLGARETDYAVLADRNIFRMYLPAPINTVKFENQDRLSVAVTLQSFWDGKSLEQLAKTVPGKSMNETQSVTGDVVEATAIYADGKTAAPVKFDPSTKPPWVMRIPSHTPPETVELVLDNQDEHAVDVSITVTAADGKSKTQPTIRVKGKSKEEPDAYLAKSVKVVATYASGKAGPTQTYAAKEGKQTLTVPVEPLEPVLPTQPTEPVEVAKDPDHDADGDLKVTGRWRYGDHQEMFALNTKTNKRVIFEKGDTIDVDGVLLATHPSGGVVYMERNKHYYLYPIGEPFTNRILLEGATGPEDLAVAIDTVLATRQQ